MAHSEATELIQKNLDAAQLACIKIASRPEDLEDILQNAKLKALKHFSSLKDKSKFRQWFAAIARNQARNFYRNRLQMVSVDDVVLYAPEQTFEKEIHETRIVKEIMLKARHILPPRQYEVFWMKSVEHQSYKEIAFKLDLKYDTVKANYRHASQKMREHFNPSSF